jgi:hypothetical protein
VVPALAGAEAAAACGDVPTTALSSSPIAPAMDAPTALAQAPTTAPAPVPARFESALRPGVDRAVLGTLVHGRPVYFGFGSCTSVLCTSGLAPTTALGASGLATLVVRAVVGATRELGCPLLLHTCHDAAALRCFLELASEEEAPTPARVLGSLWCATRACATPAAAPT